MSEPSGEEAGARSKEGAEVGKALDSLTDGGTEQSMDTNKAKAAVEKLREAKASDEEKQRQREKELAAVRIDKADAKVVAEAFNLPAKVGEQRLRENGGDLKRTLVALLNDGLPGPEE